jgi:hypothetical protein
MYTQAEEPNSLHKLPIIDAKELVNVHI